MKRRTKRNLDFLRVNQCSLCSGHHTHLSLPKQWKNDRARAYVLSLEVVSPGSQVCRLCRRDDITKVLSKSNYTPRWGKTKYASKNVDPHKCCIHNCKDSAFVCSTLGDTEQIKNAFHSIGLKYEQDNIPIPTPLCKYHYYLLYDIIHLIQRRCATCGTWLRYDSQHPCPKPETIYSYTLGLMAK